MYLVNITDNTCCVEQAPMMQSLLFCETRQVSHAGRLGRGAGLLPGGHGGFHLGMSSPALPSSVLSLVVIVVVVVVAAGTVCCG